jgi:hypothetical protein
MSKTFTITSQPFYDEYNQCYKNILTINTEPQGPLRKFVKRINFPRLSQFQREGPCNEIPKCGLVLYGLSSNVNCFKGNGCNIMTPNNILDLTSFLLSNGYQIETQITNMLNQSEVKLTNSKLSFMATYYGNAPPNIMYTR